MIEPNFDLLLWFIFITTGLRGIASILLGAAQLKRSTTYDAGDVVGGLILIFAIFLICIL